MVLSFLLHASGRRAPAAALSLVCLAAAPSGCGGGGKQTSDSPSTSDGTSSGSPTTSTTATPSTTTSEDETTVTPTVTTAVIGGDMGSNGGQCSLFMQDCPNGEKCSAWSDGSIFPNGTRCVPESPDSLPPGSECIVDGDFGDGTDNCQKGSLCLDIENDGMATCIAYCTGSMEDPKCPDQAEQRCSFLFDPVVPLCFTRCDPLIQNCGNGEACVPNIAALGAPYFVCMPRVFPEIPGKYGDSCYALSGCDPGNLCIFAENLPGCQTDYCCSVWCDLEAQNPCEQFDPTVSCVPWFEEGQASPGFETVGICGILQ